MASKNQARRQATRTTMVAAAALIVVLFAAAAAASAAPTAVRPQVAADPFGCHNILQDSLCVDPPQQQPGEAVQMCPTTLEAPGGDASNWAPGKLAEQADCLAEAIGGASGRCGFTMDWSDPDADAAGLWLHWVLGKFGSSLARCTGHAGFR